MDKRKYTFEIIIDMDIIENEKGFEERADLIGLERAFKRIERQAYKGLQDESMGFWKLSKEGIQIKWGIDYLDKIDWTEED